MRKTLFAATPNPISDASPSHPHPAPRPRSSHSLLLAVGLVMAAGWVVGAWAQEGERGNISLPEEGKTKYSHVSQVRMQIVNHPETTDEVFSELVEDLIRSTGNPQKVMQARDLFTEAVSDIDPKNNQLSKKRADQTADALINLYDMHRDEYPDQGLFIADFVARFGETAKTRKFVLSILRGTSPDLRNLQRPVVVALYWGRSFQHDAEIFNALLNLYKSGSRDMHDDSAYNQLSALARIDIDRAAPIIIGGIENARDIFTFNKVSSIASGTRRPDLMETVFKKYFTFRPVNQSVNGNPSIGVYKESVVAYLEQAEDEKLEQALSVLFSIGGHPPLSRPVIMRKLASQHNKSRKAVLSYLRKEIRRGSFCDDDTIASLNDFLKHEEAADLISNARSIIDELNARRQKGK